MTTVYLARFPKKWGFKPAVYLRTTDIKEAVRAYARDQEKDLSLEERESIENRIASNLYIERIRKLSGEGKEAEITHLSLERFQQMEKPLIKAATMKHISERAFETYYRRVRPTICDIIIEKADINELKEVENICRSRGYPDNSVFEAIEYRKHLLTWEQGAKEYYATAKITNSIPRGHRGTAKLQYEHPRMVRLRYYKGKNGKVRKTVEIELGWEGNI